MQGKVHHAQVQEKVHAQVQIEGASTSGRYMRRGKWKGQKLGQKDGEEGDQ